MPGVFLAIYELGDLAQVTTSATGSDSSGTPVTVSVNTGSGGGVSFCTFGHPSMQNILAAKQLLAELGIPGQTAFGLYYATTPLSGSGLVNYVDTLSLLKAPAATALRVYGQDSGNLDRPAFPDIDPDVSTS